MGAEGRKGMGRTLHSKGRDDMVMVMVATAPRLPASSVKRSDVLGMVRAVWKGRGERGERVNNVCGSVISSTRTFLVEFEFSGRERGQVCKGLTFGGKRGRGEGEGSLEGFKLIKFEEFHF